MTKIVFIPLIALLASCAVSNNPIRKDVRKLQRGAIKEDTSYVYALPYEEGTSHKVMQGYFGSFTHKERIALDFKMKTGTNVCSIRDGIVIRVKEDGDRGGFRKKYRPYGNNVVIQHADGYRSGYWHLQHNGVLVNVGDTVKQGQVIALSGKTGYTSAPHLHLIVWRSAGGGWEQTPTRFRTSKGAKYLRPWRKYLNKKINNQ